MKFSFIARNVPPTARIVTFYHTVGNFTLYMSLHKKTGSIDSPPVFLPLLFSFHILHISYEELQNL